MFAHFLMRCNYDGHSYIYIFITYFLLFCLSLQYFIFVYSILFHLILFCLILSYLVYSSSFSIVNWHITNQNIRMMMQHWMSWQEVISQAYLFEEKAANQMKRQNRKFQASPAPVTVKSPNPG